ncbi:unannotated protein [freshwater metagenome]|uniref:Unannotated protein n=1 Tax=freshwater metagenome TaxID=449393 RepID=A0A6J7AJ62_9ZZZZ
MWGNLKRGANPISAEAIANPLYGRKKSEVIGLMACVIACI